MRPKQWTLFDKGGSENFKEKEESAQEDSEPTNEIWKDS